jgi:hypothetical protein
MVIAAGAAAVVLCGALVGAYSLGVFDEVEGGSDSDKTRVATSPSPATASAGGPAAMPRGAIPMPIAGPNPAATPLAAGGQPAVPPAAPATPTASSGGVEPPDPDAIFAAAYAGDPAAARQYAAILPNQGTFYSDANFTIDSVAPPMGATPEELQEVARRAAPLLHDCPRTAPSRITIALMITFTPVGRPTVLPFGAHNEGDAEDRCLRRAMERAVSPTLDHHVGAVTLRIQRS